MKPERRRECGVRECFPPLEQRGVALITVLWMVALVTVMAGSFSYLVRTDILLATQQVQRVQARALAEAGVNLGLYELLKQAADPEWRGDGREYRYRLPGGEARVRIYNAAGLIDLNRAPRPLLMHLLASFGVEPSQREALIDALQDWRDDDQLVRTAGAEDAHYRRAGLAFGAKDADFEYLEELLQVFGMTPELYRRLRPYLTVYSALPGVNPNLAGPQVLTWLAEGEAEQAERWLAALAAGDSLPHSAIAPALQPFLESSSSDAFHLQAVGQVSGGGRASLEVVVARNLRDARGYTILNWRERWE